MQQIVIPKSERILEFTERIMKNSGTTVTLAIAFQHAFVLAFAFTPQASRDVRIRQQIKFDNLSLLWAYEKDTPEDLPSFETKEAYEEYLMEASGLPKGFATGSAIGKFIPAEAPAKGQLPIKGTIIHLTDGPSDNWAAVFTSNKVSIWYVVSFTSLKVITFE